MIFPSAEFEDDPDLYVLKPIKYVGIEVWQVWTIGYEYQYPNQRIFCIAGNFNFLVVECRSRQVQFSTTF